MTLRARPATDAEYWVVVSEEGRIVAQGSRQMCEDVVRYGPLVVTRMGDLFDAQK